VISSPAGSESDFDSEGALNRLRDGEANPSGAVVSERRVVLAGDCRTWGSGLVGDVCAEIFGASLGLVCDGF